jgi:hypothetical protein
VQLRLGRFNRRSAAWRLAGGSSPRGANFLQVSQAGTQAQTSQVDEEQEGSDEDDNLPPLEANTNRNKPYELYSDSDVQRF